MNTIPMICYKLKTPVVYNKGTIYEKREDTFLACYGYGNSEENKRFVAVLNHDEEAKGMFCDQHGLNADEIECFIHHKQEPFDTRDF